MNKVNRSAVVPYSCEDIYQLINKVEDYHTFVPWCHSSKIKQRNEDGSVIATLGVAHKALHFQFTTYNRGTPFTRVTMNFKHGPFKHMYGEWQLTPLGEEGCRIVLNIEYIFSNIVYEKMFNHFFNRIAETLMEAFLERARVCCQQLPHE